ncbi:hypothetical protein F4775DRAFT_559798 [Biscogniauxia sp. FL1348]|nr:hypothetical protein F4775DRAFT_559798 [Biscogniauxia sp. FL1348]
MTVPKLDRFQRPVLALKNDQAGVKSLPELIRFNAEKNPNHLFCLQAELDRGVDSRSDIGSPGYDVRNITMKQLQEAVDACVAWITQHLIKDDDDYTHPIALFMESNVGLFVYLAALLEAGLPVLLLSARLSPSSVKHLLGETKSKTILVSERMKVLIEQELSGTASVMISAPYTKFFHQPTSDDTGLKTNGWHHVNKQKQNSLILHSSGTTGMPKPIPLSYMYPIVYAACHEFPAELDINWVNMSTLPLYHGFGLLAPCLSLSVGLACCFPPTSVIPAANSTISLLSTFSAKSLMTVPSIIDDILSLQEPKRSTALSIIKDLRFVAIGGGALSVDSGSALVERGVKLLNHYGVTEIGALAPIFCPGPDYDWHYLRLRADLGLQLKPIDQNGAEGARRYKLFGFPVGTDDTFEIQDEMEVNPNSSRPEVRLLGRRDDMIVLKTGEKVLARLLEDNLMVDSNIKSAVCLGNGHFEVLVLVEPSASTTLYGAEFLEYTWNLVQSINPMLDEHARVSSKSAIIVKSPSKPIPRSDKGSIMRREVHLAFKEEIEAAYASLELETSPTVSLDTSNMEESIKTIIKSDLGEKFKHSHLDNDDDFFERGMDSLQSVRLARLLSAALRQTASKGAVSEEIPIVSAEFIYQHPTVRHLAKGLGLILSGNETPASTERDRLGEIKDLLSEFTTASFRSELGLFSETGDKVILLTGSTGNLGAHVLGHLARDKSVRNIICLNRSRPAERLNGANGTSSSKGIYIRQRASLASAGIELDEQAWGKIKFLENSAATKPFELSQSQMDELSESVTHIVHLAWPMDFKRKLPSFRPHLEAVKTFVDIARAAHEKRQRDKVRVLFASSIAVVRHYADRTGANTVPEAMIKDPLVTTRMGYAEAKWVCEQMLTEAIKLHGTELETIIMRVGQLSGPEKNGAWKTEEHIPALLKASQRVSALPRLEGTISWLPVDRAAKSLLEALFQQAPFSIENNILHLENPVRQPSQDFVTIAAAELGIGNKLVTFDEWLEKVKRAGCFPSLETFFRDEFRALGTGSVILATDRMRSVSRTLRGTSSVGKDLLVQYIDRWKEAGFLAPVTAT